MFYPELLQRYVSLLQRADAITGPNYNTEHLIWMLNELASNTGMSLSKKHRWLGFIQGVMTVHGIINVASERDYTRHIFNGA